MIVVTEDQTTTDPAVPEQPDGITNDSDDLPDPQRAAERVHDFLAEFGDGMITVAELDQLEGVPPLYARDLEALRRALAAQGTEIAELNAMLKAAIGAAARTYEQARDDSVAGAEESARRWKAEYDRVNDALTATREELAGLKARERVLLSAAIPSGIGRLLAEVERAREILGHYPLCPALDGDPEKCTCLALPAVDGGWEKAETRGEGKQQPSRVSSAADSGEASPENVRVGGQPGRAAPGPVRGTATPTEPLPPTHSNARVLVDQYAAEDPADGDYGDTTRGQLVPEAMDALRAVLGLDVEVDRRIVAELLKAAPAPTEEPELEQQSEDIADVPLVDASDWTEVATEEPGEQRRVWRHGDVTNPPRITPIEAHDTGIGLRNEHGKVWHWRDGGWQLDGKRDAAETWDGRKRDTRYGFWALVEHFGPLTEVHPAPVPTPDGEGQ